MTSTQAKALGAAGATLALVEALLTDATVGAELRAALPPEVLAELLSRVRASGRLIEAGLTEHQAELAGKGS